MHGSKATKALTVKHEVSDMMAIFNRDSRAAALALVHVSEAAGALTDSGYEARATVRTALHHAKCVQDKYTTHPLWSRLCWTGLCGDRSKLANDIQALEATDKFLSTWLAKTIEVCPQDPRAQIFPNAS